jgi:hypothetical protein
MGVTWIGGHEARDEGAVADGHRREPRASQAAAWVSGGLLAGGAACWVAGIAGTKLSSIAGYGLLSAFGRWFYVGLALILAAVIVSLLARPFRAWVSLVGLIAWIVAIYGAPAIVFSDPEYPWTYKHLGVIRYIEVHGSVDRAIDVYNNWPGVFATTAWLDRATGIDAGTYAAWAPVFFNATLLAAVLYAFGAFVADPRRRYTAACIWILGSWVGQDYLSPQAMSMVLLIAVVGVVLRLGMSGAWDRAPMGPIGRALERGRRGVIKGATWIVRGPVEALEFDSDAGHREGARRDRWQGYVLLAILGVAMITSHQLSPALLLFTLVFLTLLTGWRRLWPVIIVGTILEAGWIVLAWPSLVHLGLLDFGGAVPTPNSGAGHHTPLPGVALVQLSKQALFGIFGVLMVVGIVRLLRRGTGHPMYPAGLAALAVSPFLVVPVQSYGGEVLLRAYLVALPWMSLLATEAMWPSLPRGTSRRPAAESGDADAMDGDADWAASPVPERDTRPWGIIVLAPVLVVGLLLAYFGQALAVEVVGSDIAAETWIETQMPPGGLAFWLSPNHPTFLSARYPTLSFAGNELTSDPATLRGLTTPGGAVGAVERALSSSFAAEDYIVISPTMRNFDRMYGLMSNAQIDSVIAQLKANPKFSVVFQQDGATIIRYTP